MHKPSRRYQEYRPTQVGSKPDQSERSPESASLGFRSLMPSTRGNLYFAGFLVVTELLIAGFVGFAVWPFLLCAAALFAGIFWVVHLEKIRPRSAARGANLLCVLMVMKVSLLIVAGTGGAMSNFTGVLYVPIFLAALFYYIPGSISVGASVALFLLMFHAIEGTDAIPKVHDTSLALAGVFLFVSLVAGIFSHGLTRSARLAIRRAQLQQRRAAEFEWFMDTSMMMESLRDLDTTLSAGLIRLQELLPGNSAAIYLRETDGLQMNLVQFASPTGQPPPKKSLSLEEQEPLRVAGFNVAFWPDTRIARKEMGALQQVQPDAGSMMAVSLHTFEDVFGAIVVSAPEPDVFTERHRDLFLQFARHVVYPILRIRLHALATTDTLTGLSNHRAFRTRLQEEIERSQRYKHTVSMILIDLDHFKRVNDTQGHPAGDAILAQVGSILRRCSRATDLVARYGGEEMVILCPETQPEDALILAERIRESIERRLFSLPTGGDLKITISLGIASLPEHGKDANTLIDAADRALYDAKSMGRNRVCVASPPGSFTNPTVPAGSR